MKKQLPTALFLLLLGVYISLALMLPSDPRVLEQYDISPAQARLLSLTIVIPLSLVYLSAFYGFIRINEYADKIRRTKEGPAFKRLASGLMVLAFSLPIGSIIGSLTSYVRFARPDLLVGLTITRQYLALLLAATALVLIGKGAEGLHATLKRRTAPGLSAYWLFPPIIIASLYTWLIVTLASGQADDRPYYLPDLVVVMTITIPYVFVWCIGGWAALRLYRFQAGVKGLIYRRAVSHLAHGLAVIVIVSVLLQFLTPLSGLLNRLKLTPLLLVIYLLISLYVVGYGFVARGAQKLRQIEEA